MDFGLDKFQPILDRVWNQVSCQVEVYIFLVHDMLEVYVNDMMRK